MCGAESTRENHAVCGGSEGKTRRFIQETCGVHETLRETPHGLTESLPLQVAVSLCELRHY